jgi:uncharacterized RDD family membrane protein YckC
MAHPDVDAARAAYMEGDFVGTLSRLEAAERAPSATEADRVNIFWYRAASFHALGRAADAALAMDALLALRPMFVPNRAEASPDLRAALAERQRAYQEARGVTLGDAELLPPLVRVELRGHPEGVGRVVAFVRVPPETDYTPVALQVTGTTAEGDLATPNLWQRAGQQGRLELVLEAYTARGALAARQGDALTPVVLPVTSEMAGRAVSQLQDHAMVLAPAAVAVSASAPPPSVATAPPPAPATVEKATSPYRFGFPPWFFMLLTTGVTAACGAMGFGGCSTLGMLTSALAVSNGDGNETTSTLMILAALMTGLTCSVTALLFCAAVPLSGCTGVLWVADFFYVSPRERAVQPHAPDAEDELR